MWQKDNLALNEPLIDEFDDELEGGQDEKITVSHIYKLSRNDLMQLFNHPKKGYSEEAKNFLKDHKGNRGILQKIASDDRTGIVGDEKDLKRRKKHFGSNSKPLADPPKLMDSIRQTLQEPVWAVLVGTAVIAGIAEACAIDWTNIGSAVSIVVMTMFLITLTALADLAKDKEFVKLQSKIKDENVPVIRGKQGSTNSISVWDLVVGDVIILESGAQIPADCLLIEASELVISKGTDEDGNEMAQEQKSPYQMGIPGDPILYAGSKVIRGTGKAVVCCVGECSTIKTEDVEALGLNDDTPLQNKLHNLEGQFTLMALYSAIGIAVVFLIKLLLDIFVLLPKDEKYQELLEAEFVASPAEIAIQKIASLVNIVVVLIVVSIPDGLPITIGISLAFSVMKMYKQNILVRNLEAPEKMGGLQEICCGKTGTLTKNDMKVAQFFCENRIIINNRKDTLIQCDLSKENLIRIQESILYNCDARVQMAGSEYKAVGDGTEVGLLNFLQDADYPIHLMIQKKIGQVIMKSPMSPETKRSAVAIQNPDRPDMVTIYVKGAPEMLINNCKHISMGSIDRVQEIGQKERAQIVEQIDDMARQSLRVIGFAFIELNEQQYRDNFVGDGSQNLSDIFEHKIETMEPFFTWIGAFGLKDPLRTNVKDSIKYARDDMQLSIRLISGDHIETARTIAIQCGIIRENENIPNAVMDGATFHKLVGSPVFSKVDNEARTMETNDLENMDAFKNIIRHLRVLARATPLHKEILVRGLKAINRQVGVTGEGIEDVKCLASADVGLAMGSGCSAAKQAADLILTDNDFGANIQAIMWGRNIYYNVTRFLQFQLTVNFSCLMTVMIGGIILSESPFNAVQLLWVNLIMDTFAAIALATEPPIKSVTRGPPINEKADLLNRAVWTQVIGMSAWHTLIMTLMFIGMILSDDYVKCVSIKAGTPGQKDDISSEEMKSAAEYKRECLTLIYNTFVFLQIFNQINCRKIGAKDFNVFENFFHNFYFLAVLFGTALFQIFVNKSKLSGIFMVETMSKQEWGKCIALGSTSLLAGAVIKAIPSQHVDKLSQTMPKNMIDENKEVKSKVLENYSMAASYRMPAIPDQYGNKTVFDDDQDIDNQNEQGDPDEYQEHK